MFAMANPAAPNER